MADLDDIEDMIGEEELNRAAMDATRTPMVAPKHTAGGANVSIDTAASIPGTQLIWLKTYGCSHNVSDSEYMQGVLASYGYRFTQNADEAQLWLLNSCTVKDPSQAAFMHLVIKGKSQNKAVVVAGCVPQADRHIKGLEDVSIVGIQQVDRVVEVVEETLKGHTVRLLSKNRLPELDLPKIRKNPMVEIIPLSTGCLGACTYCKTRHARGKLGSYTPEVIVSRAQSVINEGVTEIWLSSEDTGAYGIDIGTDLPTLLRALIKIVPDGVMLRVGMTNPPYILSHLDAVAEVLNHNSVYSFLHVPVQAGSDDVLLAMNREYTSGDFRQVADHLLEKVPGLTLATDIICGFPGETEEHFDETMELVEQYRFHIMNISQFYPRPGTPAAKMKRVPTQVVKNRSRKLTKLFETFDPYPALVGTTQKVWINTEISDDQKYTIAHTKNYTKVLLPRDDTLVGCSAHVKILSCARFHVTGEVVSRSEPPTKAAMAIRQEILTGGRLSSAELANNLLPTVNTASTASCGADSGCTNCEDAGVEDTYGSSDDIGCSGGDGCGGGTGDDNCCSSGSNNSKYKKPKTTKIVAVSTSVAAVSATVHVDSVPPSRNSFIEDKFRQLCEDKIALAAVATIIASTALITGRLLFARK